MAVHVAATIRHPEAAVRVLITGEVNTQALMADRTVSVDPRIKVGVTRARPDLTITVGINKRSVAAHENDLKAASFELA
jgi:hypothetical protein